MYFYVLMGRGGWTVVSPLKNCPVQELALKAFLLRALKETSYFTWLTKLHKRPIFWQKMSRYSINHLGMFNEDSGQHPITEQNGKTCLKWNTLFHKCCYSKTTNSPDENFFLVIKTNRITGFRRNFSSTSIFRRHFCLLWSIRFVRSMKNFIG